MTEVCILLAFLTYILNIVVHLVAYLNIMDLINARKVEHIKVMKGRFALKRKEAIKLFFKANAISSSLLLLSRFHHKGSNLFK